MQYMTGHTETSPVVIKDYPYGGLRCEIRYWIETVPKKGDRFCSQTVNPKNGRLNAPKKSTYVDIAMLTRDPENGHINWVGIHKYRSPEEIIKFIDDIGGEGMLNPEQLNMLNRLKK